MEDILENLDSATVKVELTLPRDVYEYIKMRGAIDDMRPPEALSDFITKLARSAKVNYKPQLAECRICQGPHHAKGLCTRCYDLALHKGLDDAQVRAHISGSAYLTKSRSCTGARV